MRTPKDFVPKLTLVVSSPALDEQAARETAIDDYLSYVAEERRALELSRPPMAHQPVQGERFRSSPLERPLWPNYMASNEDDSGTCSDKRTLEERPDTRWRRTNVTNMRYVRRNALGPRSRKTAASSQSQPIDLRRWTAGSVKAKKRADELRRKRAAQKVVVERLRLLLSMRRQLLAKDVLSGKTDRLPSNRRPLHESRERSKPVENE